MDFNDTQEEAKFRKEASEWLKTNFDKFDSCLLYTSPSPRDVP